MPTLTNSWQSLGSATLSGSIKIYLDGRYTSQSQANNTSKVEFRLRNTGTYWRTTSGTAKFTGAYTDSKSCATYPNYIQVGDIIYSISKTVKHTTDGTKSFSIGGQVKANLGSVYTATISNVTVTLPKINRYATITSAPNFTDEENPVLNYSNPLGNSVTSLQACITNGDNTAYYASYRDINKTGTSYTFELTNEEINAIRSAIPNSNTGNVRFYVKTVVNGSTYYQYAQRTVSIINATPDETTTFLETNNTVSTLLGSTSANTIIQNVSEVQLTSTPTLQKYATLKQYQFINGVTNVPVTTSPYQTVIIPTTNEFQTTIIDSRNNTKTNTYTKTMIEYLPIDITQYSFKRVNPTSSDIVLNATIRYKQTTFNGTANAPTIQWKVGESGILNTLGSNDYTIDTENDVITITNLTLTNALSYQSEDNIYLYANDLLTEDTEHFYVTKGVPTFDAGEHDLKINGDLYVADTSGDNAVNILDQINKMQNFTTLTLNGYSPDYAIKNTGDIKLPLNLVTGSNGSLLTFDSVNHDVVIGDGVNHVEVSGSVYCTTPINNGNKTAIIMLNGTTIVARTIMYIDHTYGMIPIPPHIISVTENDTIGLYVNFSGVTSSSYTSLGNGDNGTRLVVKVID